MATFEFDPVQRDAVKAYKPSKTSKRATNLLAAIDAQERAKKPATKGLTTVDVFGDVPAGAVLEGL